MSKQSPANHSEGRTTGHLRPLGPTIARHSPSTNQEAALPFASGNSSADSPLARSWRGTPCKSCTRGLLPPHTKLYRGFESSPLRQAVCIAEKPGWISLKIAGNGRNSTIFLSKPNRRNWPTETHGLLSRPFSLQGSHAVRFQGLIRRMQRDHKTGISART